MTLASLNLAVTTFYVLLVAYLPDIARTAGPIYVGVVLILWGIGLHRDRRDD